CTGCEHDDYGAGSAQTPIVEDDGGGRRNESDGQYRENGRRAQPGDERRQEDRGGQLQRTEPDNAMPLRHGSESSKQGGQAAERRESDQLRPQGMTQQHNGQQYGETRLETGDGPHGGRNVRVQAEAFVKLVSCQQPAGGHMPG